MMVKSGARSICRRSACCCVRALLLSSLVVLVYGSSGERASKCDQDNTSELLSTLQTGGHFSARSPHPSPPHAPTPPAPSRYAPPSCEIAEVQSPRDLRPGAPGHLRPKAVTLNRIEASGLPLTNVHYHLGAEHRSTAYNDGSASEEWDAASHKEGPRPGFMCTTQGINSAHLEPYHFKHCKGEVEVGKTYEIHYVHSSAGYSPKDLVGTDMDAVDDGLGGAANGRGQLNPMIAVSAQVVLITNGQDDFAMQAGNFTPDVNASVMYPGSTTGTSFNNTICSPYAISWHVDLNCYRISAGSFDDWCKSLKDEFGLENDLEPHGSRILVDPAFVARPEYLQLFG